MTEAEFMQWFMTEPPVLEWLQILYRIKMAENGKVLYKLLYMFKELPNISKVWPSI